MREEEARENVKKGRLYINIIRACLRALMLLLIVAAAA